MIDKLIGNTPMVKITYKYKNNIRNVFAKLEYYNYTGSIKDRIAYYIIKEAKQKGILKDGMPIIEATSGNTGISFAALGALFGHEVHIFMPDWASDERKKILKLYGATLHEISKEDGGFLEAIKRADILAKEINGFRPDQFNNIDNVLAHYKNTAVEIAKKIDSIDAFVSGIGTGGTLIGIGSYLKEKRNAKVIALEPSSMPLLSSGKIISNHKIEGIGDDFIPSLVKREIIDDIILVNDDDAINMSKMLAHKFGLGVGISSGANFLAAVLSGYDNVATVFADDFKKYLSTDLTSNINNNTFISNNIELIKIEAL